MSLLSYNELLYLQESGALLNSSSEYVQGASIDVHLGEVILAEIAPPVPIDLDYGPSSVYWWRISLREREPLHTKRFVLCGPDDKFDLMPGEFVLAHTKEIFNLPLHISAQYALNSSVARIGLEHSNAGWCDPGWTGSALTLELKNISKHHVISLRAGDRIGQMKFFSHTPVPPSASYARRGSYNNTREVSGALPWKKTE